jgi:ribonuclease HI
MPDILIFTDGSSRGNPGPGGWAAIISYPHTAPGEKPKAWVTELGGHEVKATNNQMELEAAIEALIKIQHVPGNITIHTDSSYVIQGITKWIKGWIQNGWITKTKEEVLNRNMWEILASLIDSRDREGSIIWKHISGHAGIPANERCDEIATAYADKQNIKLYDGPQKEYSVSFDVAHNREKKLVKDTKRARSNAPAYSYLSYINGKIEMHKTWAECEARVKGASGAKFKKALSKEEEQEIIESWK